MGQLATKTNSKDWLMYNDYKVESKVLYIVNSLLIMNCTSSVVVLLLNPLKIMFEIPILAIFQFCQNGTFEPMHEIKNLQSKSDFIFISEFKYHTYSCLSLLFRQNKHK